jgi:hypothetical protein
MAFDYILYGGCLVFALELTYLESRFQLLRDYWDFYFLFSACLFFVLAYRFDNRFVLSLALTSLAGWFGIRISQFSFNNPETLRSSAIGYGVIVAAAGWSLFRWGVKKHFTETYLHIAANVLFVATLSGIQNANSAWVYLPVLLILCALAIAGGVHFKRFVFVAYGTLYAYVGISIEVLRNNTIDSTFALMYLIISSSLVIIALAFLARMFGREE